MDKEQGEVCDIDLRAPEGDQPQVPMSEGAPGLQESSKAIVITSGNGNATGTDEFLPLEAKGEKIIKYLYKECLRNHDASVGGHAIDGCGEFMSGGEEGSTDALKCAACGCHRNFHRREVEGKYLYRECLRNHNASTGGHALDGCGEFMSGGEEGTPNELKCAACDCHRNFHRREVEGEPPSCECHQIRKERKSAAEALPHTPVALPATPDDQDGGISASAAAMKKRFRTKFSTEQKERMLSFADKLGWKIQKPEERAVQAFCAEIGVKRHIFKVWMHNNKHGLGKKS